MLICNKLDEDGAAESFQVLEELYASEYPMAAVSASRGDGLDELRRTIFRMLNVIRVYSKPPGKDAEMERPYTLKNGSTLLEFANLVHHDFGEKLRFARIWGHTKFDGQRVTKDYILQDKDVVELHI
jgi:ribosome-interacting GTPase 1